MIERAKKSRIVHAAFRFRTALVVLLQLALIVGAYFSAVTLRMDLDAGPVSMNTMLTALPLLIAVRLAALTVFRLHQGLWRYVSIGDLLQIIKASTVGSVVFAGLALVFFESGEFPLSFLLLDWAANILLLGGVRLAVRLLRERVSPIASNRSKRRLLIVGGGDAGAELCRQALSRRSYSYRPVAFVDDDPSKIGTSIFGVPIAGPCESIAKVVAQFRADVIVIAIPSANHAQRLYLVQMCDQAGVPFRILPSEPSFGGGTVDINRVRDLDPSDLLGRPSAQLDTDGIRRFIGGKRVLITGAAGSVGAELSRQIAALGPNLLCLIDRAENPLMFLETDLRRSFPDVFVADQIGDVTDHEEMAQVMDKFKPEIVFHAAAHKHVHLMERTPREAVKNNIGGTLVTAICAQQAGVETFVFVSTDKAVNPTSVMGATKRAAEALLQSMNDDGPTRFISVRFGNVLGSNASVVPIFQQQISAGGPVTVTDADAERYFMSIQEAARLILQAALSGNGGEIFVLDMGEPIKILVLAETLIRLAGLKPYEDIDIVFTGLRPGEKLSEKLHLDSEDLQSIGHDKLLVLKDLRSGQVTPEAATELLRRVHGMDGEEVRYQLTALVPEFQPTGYVPQPALG